MKAKWKQKQNEQNKKLKNKMKITKQNKWQVNWKKEIICQFSVTVDMFS